MEEKVIIIHDIFGHKYKTRELLKIRTGGVMFKFINIETEEEQNITWNDLSHITTGPLK